MYMSPQVTPWNLWSLWNRQKHIFVPLILSEQNQKVLLGSCWVLWLVFQKPEAVWTLALGSHIELCFYKRMFLTGYPKGGRVYALSVRVWWGQQERVLGKEDAFMEHTLSSCWRWWYFWELFWNKDRLAQCYGCSCLQHKFSFFPLQEVCTIGIFFIFDFPFLSGMAKAKIIHLFLCCELLGQITMNERMKKWLLPSLGC